MPSAGKDIMGFVSLQRCLVCANAPLLLEQLELSNSGFYDMLRYFQRLWAVKCWAMLKRKDVAGFSKLEP
ncbi:hypothetical protein KL925_001871 [Ogataea polymorpha]|nr:hypothetical protein KL925_001871 [Ogataea polymorpha]